MRAPIITPLSLGRVIHRAKMRGCRPAAELDALAGQLTVTSGRVEDVAPAFHQLFFALCGTDDSVDVETYSGPDVSPQVVVAASRPVAQIKWVDDLAARFSGPGEDPGNVAGLSWGTGVLVADRLLLTAGHLFSELGGRRHPTRNGQPIDGDEVATLLEARFNYQVDSAGQPRPTTTLPIVGLPEWRDTPDVLDYALASVGDNAAGETPAAFGAAPLAAPAELSEAEPIFCIQHWCSSTGTECDQAGRAKRVAVGRLAGEPKGGWINHLIDTMPGASGAPVFDRNGRIIAVQINGWCDSGPGFNNAVTVGRIAAASPRVRALVQP